MASRPIVPKQPLGSEALDKHHFFPVAEGNNRRALEDIGNRINGIQGGLERKPQVIIRPITKFKSAKDGQTYDKNAATLDKKEGLNVNSGAKVPKQEIIVISPDTEEERTRSIKKNLQEGSSRRKVQTLTSVLTRDTYDIDSADVDDQLAMVDYVDDIYKFYRLAERLSKFHDYMNSQVGINEKMRAILTDWLIDVHNKFELMPETLYLTIHIVDRYLSLSSVLRRELQLVGIAAMLIASKYEEIWSPEVNDFVCISDKAYTRQQILIMEKLVLNKLEWNITVPTPYAFTVRFLKAAAADEKMKHLAFFFTELALVQYAMIKFRPSMIAASAVYAASCTLNKSPRWSGTLEYHTGLSEPQLVDCTTLLVSYHSKAAQGKRKAVYKKYSSPQRNAVSLLPPAGNLVEVIIIE